MKMQRIAGGGLRITALCELVQDVGTDRGYLTDAREKAGRKRAGEKMTEPLVQWVPMALAFGLAFCVVLRLVMRQVEEVRKWEVISWT